MRSEPAARFDRQRRDRRRFCTTPCYVVPTYCPALEPCSGDPARLDVGPRAAGCAGSVKPGARTIPNSGLPVSPSACIGRATRVRTTVNWSVRPAAAASFVCAVGGLMRRSRADWQRCRTKSYNGVPEEIRTPDTPAAPANENSRAAPTRTRRTCQAGRRRAACAVGRAPSPPPSRRWRSRTWHRDPNRAKQR
jgi:hypothetical protein